jgi:hypothetical protein
MLGGGSRIWRVLRARRLQAAAILNQFFVSRFGFVFEVAIGPVVVVLGVRVGVGGESPFDVPRLPLRESI